MGNCVCAFKGTMMGFLDEETIKVVTSNGGIMEFHTPITVECITNEFPGHRIYRSCRDLFLEGKPLHHNEELRAGELYHLLPLNLFSRFSSNQTITRQSPNNAPATSSPYRTFTYDNNKNNMRSPEVFPRCNNTGVWKAKLVISPEQLSEILSQESRTKELIESARTVAKCGNGVPNSNHGSVSGSSSYLEGSFE